MRVLHTPAEAAQWLRERVQGGALCSDSRTVQAGDAFIAWPGTVRDGRAFVASALAQGAQACLVEQEGAGAFALPESEALACYPGLKRDTGAIAALFWGEPALALRTVAVTGTNGKTSTTWWLAQALQAVQGQAAGVIGTLGVGRVPAPGDAQAAQALRATGLTTPDPVTLQHTLHEFARSGVVACAMEASSIGLQEQRLAGTHLDVAVFTNFTQDHLDYHGDMTAYWAAKRALFDWPGLRAAVINTDDSQGAALAQDLQAGSGLDLWTVSAQRPARLRALDIRFQGAGLHFVVQEGAQRLPLASQVIGQYNVSNLLGVLGALRALGVPLDQAVAACEALRPVPGRMECLGGSDAPLVAVDYAHTPDALDQVLRALRPIAQQRGGALWCVFGCGGDRDATKRPLMGAIAARQADRVVLTSDNPRSEKPEAIVAQVLLGVTEREHVDVEVDRGRAIAYALGAAAPQDVVVLAGKGHETYQEAAGRKLPFSDLEQARVALAQRTAAGGAGAPGAQAPAGVFTAAALAALVPGATVQGEGLARADRVHTDTRTVQRGDVFVALRGERFDAHDFLQDALTKGATVLVCQRGHGAVELPAGCARIDVDDTHAALTAMAQGWRAQLRQVPVIAITGSNGKTTVTQMVASILRAAAGADCLATQGNLNNDIGVPLTVLRLRAQHRWAVVELGMNHPGEIAELAAVAQPDVALVNNAQREHQEFMHTVEAVARENGAVLQALPVHGVAVFPQEDAFSPLWRSLAAPTRVQTFGAQADAAVALEQAEWGQGAWQVQARVQGQALAFALQVAGRHNVINALAAAACAWAAGVPLQAIAQGLQAFEPVKGRSRALALRWGERALTLVDDSYNANPDSVRAAIDVLAELPGPGVLVLGDMGEVGDQGAAFHAEVGAYAQQRGIAQVLLLGELARHATVGDARHFENLEALLAALAPLLAQAGSVLVKGSRFMRMERVVEAVQTACAATQEGAC